MTFFGFLYRFLDMEIMHQPFCERLRGLSFVRTKAEILYLQYLFKKLDFRTEQAWKEIVKRGKFEGKGLPNMPPWMVMVANETSLEDVSLVCRKSF